MPLLFVITGWASYILASFQGSNEALPVVNELTHFTQYVPGHAHLALLFFASSTVIGGAYYVIPRIYGCALFSRRLARAEYAFYVIGFAFYFIGFTASGLIQGSSWVNLGLPVWTVLPALRAWMAMRIMGGTLLVISFCMFAYNVFATIIVRRPYAEPDFRDTPEPTFRTAKTTAAPVATASAEVTAR